MASPPFSLSISSPANTDIAANFPPLDRSDKDIIQSWLLIQMNSQGHDNYTLIDGVGTVNGPGSPPTPSAGTAAIYYDSNKVLQEYRGDTATVIQLSVPIGAVLDFAGTSAPNGYVLCAGQAISRTTYAVLFGILGTTYGAGDGSTTFNVPDYRGRTSYGVDNMGGSAANRLTSGGSGITGTTLGATGGSETVILTTAQLPAHNHAITDPGHIHNLHMQGPTGSITATGGQLFGAGFTTNEGSTDSATTGITIQNTGSGNAHLNVGPAIVVNKIIRAL